MTLSLSVITPSFNQGRFIERTIFSVISQGIVDLEYVVCDGGSSDDTVRILRRHETALRWVSERDRGQAHAVNKGLQATSGEIICWLNSDDLYHPGALLAVQQFFRANPDVDLVYGDAHHINEDDDIIEAYYTEEPDLQRLQEICYICQPAAFFRRRVVEHFGGLDESLQYCMDYEYWLRLAQGGARFAYMRTPLAGSRLYQQNKTLGARLKVHREINTMLRRRLGYVPDRWIYNYAHAVMDHRGVPRAQTLRYSTGLAIVSIYASLRWNRRVPRSVAVTSYCWVRDNARLSLQKALTR